MDESPDTHPEKDFMELLNPESLKIIEAYVEPSLKDAKPGDRFQFQRMGYFNVDDDSAAEHLVFNKTVGLRDSWEKRQPDETKSQAPKPSLLPRKAIDVIQQLGKKYTNLPEGKQEKAKQEIQELANNVSYEELRPLFETATKKVGTRIATMIALKVLLENGLKRNQDIEDFISNAIRDNNELLVTEAKNL
jgi:glutaminyl-tRNA synthetase